MTTPPLTINCKLGEDGEVIPDPGYRSARSHEDGGYRGECQFDMAPGRGTDPACIIALKPDSEPVQETWPVPLQLEALATSATQYWNDAPMSTGTIDARDPDGNDVTATTGNTAEWESYLADLNAFSDWQAATPAAQVALLACRRRDSANGQVLAAVKARVRVSIATSPARAVPFPIIGWLNVTTKDGEYAAADASCRATSPPTATQDCEPDMLEYVGAFSWNINWLGSGFIEWTDIIGPPGMTTATVRIPFIIPAGQLHSSYIDFAVPAILDPSDPVAEWGLRFRQVVIDSLETKP